MHPRGKSFVAFRERDGALEVSKGALTYIEEVFDNSAEKRADPDPTKRVRWGQHTTEEMLIGSIDSELAHEIARENR